MEKYDISIDLDDVVFDTMESMLTKLKESGKIPDNIHSNDITCPHVKDHFGWDPEIDLSILNEDFFRNLDLISQTRVDDINYLIESGLEICFITARMKSLSDVTSESLGKFFNNPKIFFETSRNKYKIAKEFGIRAHIDDRAIVALSMATVVDYSFLLPMKHNEYLKEIHSSNIFRLEWEFVIKMIKDVL